MCGIYGLVSGSECNIDNTEFFHTIERLCKFSESRGKEASGVVTCTEDVIYTFKSATPATEMLKTTEFTRIKQHLNESLKIYQNFSLIGHSRLVTNGSANDNLNNQPVLRGNSICIHNGIVVNVDQLWNKFSTMSRMSDLDTEVLLALQDEFTEGDDKLNKINSLRKVFQITKGVINLAQISSNEANLILATNNGSIYYAKDNDSSIFIFASEKHIVKSSINKSSLFSKDSPIFQLEANTGMLVDLKTSNFELFDLLSANILSVKQHKARSMINLSSGDSSHKQFLSPREIQQDGSFNKIEKEYQKCKLSIDKIKRCTKCVLPETIPFINFDSHGVCNYCNEYSPIELKGRDIFAKELESLKRTDGGPECVFGFSGGRDSSYGLHLLCKEYDIKPLAYTYDWGMVTDLARRNQSRMCSELGIEHIIVSADIKRKRDNIKSNVSAWLKKPDLGLVPLFMAGDKQFYYYANQLSKQNNIKKVMFSENLFEKTFFKSGFCGIKPSFNQSNTYTMSTVNKLKLIGYYGKGYLTNSGYLNKSLIDTMGAFISYYAIPHNYLWQFQYLAWNENISDEILLNQYNWEVATDTDSTWRIGDGTAPFYNYIYYIMAGFTENDSLRSNQIREGHITRNEGLRLVERDNRPRFDSLKWYFDTIGVDMELAVDSIHKAKKLYQHNN
jgi:hypothetical protein